MEQIFDILAAIFLVIGGFFGFVGSFGLLKLGDPMSRLHAPTKATTLGVGGVLIASLLHSFGAEGYVSVHELLITLFLFLTAPITALFIAKAHIHRHGDDYELPPTGGDASWAVLSDSEEEPVKTD
ncbi:Na+/H+ antiporter subunit G [Arenibacterium halophilum]|jgi:multicomponent K+:H+ antiporter subunit G|uniref:Na+/H+ antiporter subunit G n=1 Tax=Arenibacterium halophilum TaxID=2583821 RepID=A0ABY2XAP1_9RHOB|nr:Na+/H+ antiporter subunit G [Arenibacterium halophilum]MAY88660.1 Na+/H+ antiporter subunit G [Pseudooceanicola sp.]TMV12920.1 Na+/H+ antiporter subunit G [Arenibacterium halophilum]|tara:strand:- start:1527 stop:1904 length:378 start_codon:yes stop_codon:yes gene_type:complete